MTPRRFYFTIKSANVVECVHAHSLPFWNELVWLNPETVTDPNSHA